MTVSAPEIKNDTPKDSKFAELDVLRSASGWKGIISQRRSNGVITFSIVKEFERDGIADWTSFCPENQINEFEDMLGLIKARILELRADPKTPPVRVAGGRR